VFHARALRRSFSLERPPCEHADGPDGGRRSRAGRAGSGRAFPSNLAKSLAPAQRSRRSPAGLHDHLRPRRRWCWSKSAWLAPVFSFPLLVAFWRAAPAGRLDPPFLTGSLATGGLGPRGPAGGALRRMHRAPSPPPSFFFWVGPLFPSPCLEPSLEDRSTFLFVGAGCSSPLVLDDLG